MFVREEGLLLGERTGKTENRTDNTDKDPLLISLGEGLLWTGLIHFVANLLSLYFVVEPPEGCFSFLISGIFNFVDYFLNLPNSYLQKKSFLSVCIAVKAEKVFQIYI